MTQPPAPTPLSRFLATCVELVGTPYLWWAKGDRFGFQDPISQKVEIREVEADRDGRRMALDCSGFVTVPAKLVGGPDLVWTHRAKDLYRELRPTKSPVPGDLAFYGGAEGDDWKTVDHVMVVLAILPTGAVMVIGASGGGKKTTSLEIARASGAKVKVKHSHLYRADFRGFRTGLFHP